MLRITAEPFHSQGKAVLNGTSSTWQNGDQIRFSNGTLATVSITDGNFYISQSGIASGTSAVYPASIVKDAGDGAWTLTLPESYQYAADGSGHQIIDMPLAAYYTGDGTVFFKHLTGGLYFTVTNNTGSTVRLDRITVENETYYMNGSTLPLSAITTAFLSGDRTFTGSGDEESRKRVSLLFNNGYELANGSSKQFLVPVPAFSTDAAFTITVYAHNGTVSRYLFNQTQGVEHTSHISAAEVGYANISLGNNVQSHPFEGNGTYASPYQIYTKEDYLRMVDSVNGSNGATYRTKYYNIAANINMGGETVDGLRSFAGVIDGKGHTISNVCFGNSDNSGNLGMISTLIEAYDTIRNLTLDYVSFTEGGAHVGAFIGYGNARYTYVRLINCHLVHITYNNTLAATAYVGGLVGFLGKSGIYHHDSYFIGCSIEQPLSLTTTTCTNLYFGGLIGNIAYGGSTMNISDCSINADMTVNAPNATLRFGGILGSGGGLAFTDNTFKDGIHITLSAKGTLYSGALIGAGSGDPCNINGCTVTSLVMNCTTATSGTSYVGGLIGDGVNYSNAKNFDNCTVSGSITITKGTNNANSYMGMVLGKGNNSGINWDGRGNSASVTLTVTNAGSTNDHLGNIYGDQDNYGSK